MNREILTDIVGIKWKVGVKDDGERLFSKGTQIDGYSLSVELWWAWIFAYLFTLFRLSMFLPQLASHCSWCLIPRQVPFFSFAKKDPSEAYSNVHIFFFPSHQSSKQNIFTLNSHVGDQKILTINSPEDSWINSARMNSQDRLIRRSPCEDHTVLSVYTHAKCSCTI